MHNIRIKNGDIVAVGTNEDCFDVIGEYLGSEIVNMVSECCADKIEVYRDIAKVESEKNGKLRIIFGIL